jgi:hypothetical protein
MIGSGATYFSLEKNNKNSEQARNAVYFFMGQSKSNPPGTSSAFIVKTNT